MILLSCKHPGEEAVLVQYQAHHAVCSFGTRTHRTHSGNAPPYSEVLSLVSFMLPFFAQHQEQRSGWKAVVGYRLVSWPAVSAENHSDPLRQEEISIIFQLQPVHTLPVPGN